jgi:hypothetical protein
MFEFYLSSCELGFRNASMGVFQIQLAREQTAVPLTREYITAVDRGVTQADIEGVMRQSSLARLRMAGNPNRRQSD